MNRFSLKRFRWMTLGFITLFGAIVLFSLTGFLNLGNFSNPVITPDEGHDKMILAIQNAKKSIFMEIYHLTDPKMINALLEAQKRNVDVQVVMDVKSIETGKSYQQTYNNLTEGGVKVHKSSPLFSITHSKAFVVDESVLFISTMNFVKRWDLMRDIGFFTHDPLLIQDFINVFKADIDNGQNQEQFTPQPLSKDWLVSPLNSETKLIQLIGNAKQTIHIAVENLGSRNILAALKEAEQRGVEVKLLTPECTVSQNPTWNYSFLYELRDAGVENHVMPYQETPNPKYPYVHQKFLIADGNIAYLGSQNFSFNSMTKAREMGVIVRDFDNVQVIETVFSRDWENSIPLAPQAPTHCKVLN